MSHLAAGRAPSRLPSLFLVLLLVTASAAAVVGAVLWGPAPASAAGAPPCTPKIVKSGGKTRLENCGPATLTLKFGGRTYHYKDGLCQDSKSAGAKLSLDLGTLVAGAKGNGGEPYLSLLIPAADIDGSVFEADYGGKQLFGDNLISYSDGTATGTFHSDHTDEEFSGSWNCHGVIWHAP